MIEARLAGALPGGGRAWRRAAAVLAAVALALVAAAPRFAAAAEADPELQLVYRPPAAEQSEPPRMATRAYLEFGAVLLYENLDYWATYGDWVEDWQFAFTWDDQKKKLLQLKGVRFDSNDFQTNWTHAYAGSMYYNFGRINNLGVGESFLMAAFESVYWESVVEYREVFSINDTFMTIFGALSIGEPYYQLARYLTTREDPMARALGFISPVMGIQALLDPASRPRRTDNQTLPGYGVFLVLGAATVDANYPSDTGTFTTVGLRSRFVLAPGFTAPGTESRQGWEVLASTADFCADLEGGNVQELDVFSRAVFYGRVDRSVGDDSRGSASILGFGSAFTLFRKDSVAPYDRGGVPVHLGYDLHLEEPRDFRDKYAIVHLFGPVYEGFWRGRTLGVTWAMEAYPDFGMINAYGLNAYSVDHDLAGDKTTLLYDGYYYGYGVSGKARVEASAGPVTIGAVGSLHYHASIEGLDRFQDDLTTDVRAWDTWFRLDANLTVRIPRTPLAVEASARWSSRRGAVGDVVARGTESRYALEVTWRL